MQELSKNHCVACHKGAPPVPEIEWEEMLKSIPGWEITYQQNTPRLIRHFPIKSFSKRMAFVNEIALMAEKEDHHPVITIGAEKVIVKWWTHIIGNLHRNDFIMAAKTNDIFGDLIKQEKQNH